MCTATRDSSLDVAEEDEEEEAAEEVEVEVEVEVEEEVEEAEVEEEEARAEVVVVAEEKEPVDFFIPNIPPRLEAKLVTALPMAANGLGSEVP